MGRVTGDYSHVFFVCICIINDKFSDKGVSEGIITMTQSTYEQFFPRSTNHIGEIADFLYKEVLLYCESDKIAGLKGKNNINNNFLSLLQGKVILDKSSKVVISAKPHYLDGTIDVKGLDNIIHLVSSTQNLAIDVLRHIRNACAHNLVVIDNDYVIIGDFLTHRSGINFAKPTMLGRLTIANLKFLISQAKSLSK